MVVAALVLLSPIASATPPAQPPRVGIDTTFGDRFHEAVSALRLKHYQDAIAKANVALAMQPDDTNAALLFIVRGTAYFWLKEEAGAWADLKAASQRDPKIKNARDKLGWLNYRRGNYQDAVADFTAFLPGAKDPGYIYYQRAEAYKKLGQSELVRRDFLRVTQAPVLQAMGYAERGVAFGEVGDYRSAERDFAKAKRMDSSDAHTLNTVAWFHSTAPLAASRNGRAAVQDATKACRYSKWKNPDFIDTLAAAYAETANFGDAVAYEKQAIALETNLKERKGLQEHLALFEKGRPVREDPTIK